MADNTKPCSKCKKVLPLTDFVKARKLANGDQGYRSFCMPCRNREARNTKPFDYTKNPVNSKKCNKCNKVLSIEHFFKQRVRSDGYRNICKPCMGFTMPEILPEGMKRCARCNKVLSKTKFNRDSRKDKSLIAKDGLKSYCSTCQDEYRKEWLEENKEECKFIESKIKALQKKHAQGIITEEEKSSLTEAKEDMSALRAKI